MTQSPSTLPPEDRFQVGIDQFNQGDYYACHDTLEAIWMEATIPEKPFFQGILQLAVALYHLSNHNAKGAAILLGEGIKRLEPFEPDYRGVNVTALLDCADAWLASVQQLDPTRVALLADVLAGSSPVASEGDEAIELPRWKIQLGEA